MGSPVFWQPYFTIGLFITLLYVGCTYKAFMTELDKCGMFYTTGSLLWMLRALLVLSYALLVLLFWPVVVASKLVRWFLGY